VVRVRPTAEHNPRKTKSSLNERASDSLAVRSFLRLPVDEPPPEWLVPLLRRRSFLRLCVRIESILF